MMHCRTGKMKTPPPMDIEKMLRLVKSMDLNNHDAMESTIYGRECFKEASSHELKRDCEKRKIGERAAKERIHRPVDNSQPKRNERINISSYQEYTKYMKLYKKGKLSPKQELVVYASLLDYKMKSYEVLWSDSSKENSLPAKQASIECNHRFTNNGKRTDHKRIKIFSHAEYVKYLDLYKKGKLSSTLELIVYNSLVDYKKKSHKEFLSNLSGVDSLSINLSKNDVSNPSKGLKQKKKSEPHFYLPVADIRSKQSLPQPRTIIFKSAIITSDAQYDNIRELYENGCFTPISAYGAKDCLYHYQQRRDEEKISHEWYE